MNRLFYIFKKVPLYMATVLLFCSSIFFYFGAQQKRAALNKSDLDAFADSIVVTVTGVIDGDEIQVQSDSGEVAVVRLLGIKSFSTTGEFELAAYGEMSTTFLKSGVVGKRVQLHIGEKKSDSNKRLLAFVHLPSREGGSVDLGKLMIEKGVSIAYTKYPFDRMNDYLLTEQLAARKLVGLWGNEKMRNKVYSLKKQWQEVRK